MEVLVVPDRKLLGFVIVVVMVSPSVEMITTCMLDDVLVVRLLGLGVTVLRGVIVLGGAELVEVEDELVGVDDDEEFVILFAPQALLFIFG